MKRLKPLLNAKVHFLKRPALCLKKWDVEKSGQKNLTALRREHFDGLVNKPTQIRAIFNRFQDVNRKPFFNMVLELTFIVTDNS